MKFNKILIGYAALTVATFSLTSCLSSDEETIVIETPSTGIPDDSKAEHNPNVSNTNTYVPNPSEEIEYIKGIPVIRLTLNGVRNSDGTDWLRLYGTGSKHQNVWVEVDGKPKGIVVYNNADERDHDIKTDIIFCVDNSGSMDDEADALARDIMSWSQLLNNSGINARFGVVGYDGRITGALNITRIEDLNEFLDYGSGTGRTEHFSGSDASQLRNKTANYSCSGECGAAAIRFADENFAFRTGANRVYVNFTDEPNQPGISNFSVLYFENQNNWPAAKGTVHTVYSDSKFTYNNWNKNEQPWLISEYTGGTTIFAPSNFNGVTLESLPVTGAMENSYIISFTNIKELLDGQYHRVHITILDEDGNVRADKVFNVIFGDKQ